ncbi:glutathione S-transferase family protein [Pseudooceanicola sp.]|uniref:glutathione S-transferase family protein n=1 Tax=Pseudooceanicola sp. TaxID=1914328 RepID=UPI0035C69185
MTDLTLVTFDWVPDLPRGYVRDLRIRWALNEANLPYTVASVPFRDRTDPAFEAHPFDQVPWIEDAGRPIFESGAILLYLGRKSTALMPEDQAGRDAVTQWVLAALNSVEMAVLPWTLYRFVGDKEDTPGRAMLEQFLTGRLTHMEQVLAHGGWLTGQFTVADILMSDVLRLADRFDALADFPACRAYVEKAKGRPAFQAAHDDQMAHFAAAD